MKRLINLKTGAMLLLLMALSGTSAYANVEDFVLSVRNVTQRTATTNILEFDLYLIDDDNTQTFEFAGCQIGLLLNSSIFNGGTLTVTIDNSESELDPDQLFVNAPDVVTTLADYPGQALIRLAANSVPPVPPGAGSGTEISSTGYGTLLTHFVITSTVDFAPNSYANLEFTSGTADSPFYPTIVYTYISGTSTPLYVTPEVDAIVDGNPLLNPTLPAAFNVTGSGSYCTENNGREVGLSGSELNVTYTLYRDEITVTQLDGTGSALTFGIRPAGTYTITGNNAVGPRTMTGEAVIVNATVAVSITGSSTICAGATTTLAPASGGTWASNNTSVATVTNAGLVTGISAGQATFTFTESTIGCASTTSPVTVNALPGAAGPISGPTAFTPGTTGVVYSVDPISAASTYIWNYSGDGVDIYGSGNSVTLDFSALATSGTLSVFAHNSCGDGAPSSLPIGQDTKTLNITLFLEGLYNNANGLVKVQDSDDGESSYDLFPGTTADTLSVEIRDVTAPYSVVYTGHGIPVNTDGTVNINSVPGDITGNRYIVIKHKNHVETWSQSTSFSATVINYNFTDAVSRAWGNNLLLTGSVYCIYSGDTNSDQYVDGFDLAITFNNNKLGAYGCQLSDINGDGFVDGFDLAMVFNNNKRGAGMNTPLAPLE